MILALWLLSIMLEKTEYLYPRTKKGLSENEFLLQYKVRYL